MVCNLLNWQSKPLKQIARSSMVVETLAMLDGIDAALYISALLKKLCKDWSIQIQAYTDRTIPIQAYKSLWQFALFRKSIMVGSELLKIGESGLVG